MIRSYKLCTINRRGHTGANIFNTAHTIRRYYTRYNVRIVGTMRYNTTAADCGKLHAILGSSSVFYSPFPALIREYPQGFTTPTPPCIAPARLAARRPLLVSRRPTTNTYRGKILTTWVVIKAFDVRQIVVMTTLPHLYVRRIMEDIYVSMYTKKRGFFLVDLSRSGINCCTRCDSSRLNHCLFVFSALILSVFINHSRAFKFWLGFRYFRSTSEVFVNIDEQYSALQCEVISYRINLRVCYLSLLSSGLPLAKV